MGVTTKDLAKICGVSRATITRALHGTGSIKPETKQMILETAEKMGYQPDLLARSLVKGVSMTIGVIVVDLKNQYFSKMINAMEKKMIENKYLLNITLHENDHEIEKMLIQTLVGHRVDGLIISPSSYDKVFWKYLKELPVPSVVIGNKLDAEITTVGIDEKKATRSAVNFIYERGYKHIIFVVPPLQGADSKDNMGHHQRLEGYCSAVKELGLDQMIIYGDQYLGKIIQYMKKTKDRPAFLCSGDVFAIEAYGALRKSGYLEKRDFGIMGFDHIDIPFGALSKLSTVDNHIEEIGEQAAEQILGMIRGERGVRHLEIPYKIIEGETV